MKYSVKKGKDAKGNTWYQYTGTLKDGKTFTGKNIHPNKAQEMM